MLFEHPTEEQWERIMDSVPFSRQDIPKLSLQKKEKIDGGVDEFYAGLILPTWESHLINRVSDLCHSYGLLMFHYEIGIPDNEWRVANGSTITYFPHFQDHHHFVKQMFDFYTDVFYYKAFSVWDTTGQALNEMYQLGMKVEDASFVKCVRKVESLNIRVHERLYEITQNKHYKNAQEFRHSITHRHPANKLGPFVRKINDKNVEGFSFRGSAYITSKEIVANVGAILTLLAETFRIIKEECS